LTRLTAFRLHNRTFGQLSAVSEKPRPNIKADPGLDASATRMLKYARAVPRLPLQ